MDMGKDLAKMKAIQTGTKVWTQKERFTTWSYKMFGDKIYSFSVKSLCNHPKLSDDTPMIHLCMTWHTQRGFTFQSQKEHCGQLVFCGVNQEKQLTDLVE